MVEKKILGRKDRVDFPSFGLHNVPVKIDSGAYSSSMHCKEIDLIEEDGKEILEVVFLDESYPGFVDRKMRFTSFKRKTVKSSNGIAQERFFIIGTIKLFGETVETVFSLTERSGLRNPILLGRKLLNKRYLIDTSKTNCSNNWEKKNKLEGKG